MLKFVRQTIRLSMLWVAICMSLAGMLTYTKSGLQLLLADYLAEQSTPAKPAAAAPRFRAQ